MPKAVHGCERREEEGSALKRCRMCGRDLEEPEFAIDRSMPDGLNANCRSCMRRIRARQPTLMELAEKRRRRAMARMMSVAREDTATIYDADLGWVVIRLPPMEG